VVGGLTFLCHTGGLPSRGLPRQLRETLANPNRQLAFIFEEPHIASMIHEVVLVDKCGFEFLKIVIFEQSPSLFVDPLEQVVFIPLFYLLECGLCVAGLLGKGVHGG